MKANIEILNDFMDALIHCDTVKVILTGCGEKEFTTKEIYNAIAETSNRKAELEDKLEQGTLIEPPCNVGDIVYVNKKTLFDWYTFLEFKKYVRAEVIGIKVTKKQKLVNLRPITERACNTRYHEFYPFSSFGKTVFLTESEAKAELERRANE